MATTPKRSLKRTLASTVEDRSPRFLLGSLALAMVISLVAGLGIGYKVEQHRVESKKTKTTATTKKKKKTTKKKTATAKVGTGPVFAKVVSTAPKLLVVSTGTGRLRLVMLKKTTVDLTKAADASAIVPGAHVLVAYKKATSTGTTTTGTAGPTGTTATKPPAVATEVVVVTGAAAKFLGSEVESAGAGTMTLKFGTAKITVSISGARIEETEPGVASDLSPGRKVAVRAYKPVVKATKTKKKTKKKKKAVKTSTYALDVVLLPSDSLL
jgi:hypothetical protein